MILVGMPATMTCDEPGCAQTIPADLVLLASGGFGFRPHPLDSTTRPWQVRVEQNSAFGSRCPEHAAQVERVIVPGVSVNREERRKLLGETH